jgi:hypothetical protein
MTGGRCYDHNFLRFLTIFGEKMAFFSKTNVLIKILHNLALFFAEFIGENILKIVTSVPGTRFRPYHNDRIHTGTHLVTLVTNHL